MPTRLDRAAGIGHLGFIVIRMARTLHLSELLLSSAEEV
jgi:hypothetical protein